MITPESLRQSRESYAVILLGLVRDVEQISNAVFFMMEGKDSDYYRPRISAVFSGGAFVPQYRNCRGKKNMKHLLAAVRSNQAVNRARILFFFDRDYENDYQEIVGDECYVTDGYSVENHYTSRASAESCISSTFFSDVLDSDSDRQELKLLLNLYDSLQMKFHECVLLFNAWAWVQRYVHKIGKLDLDSFDVSDQVRINVELGTLTRSYTLMDLNALCPEREPVSEDELLPAYEWFSTRSCQRFFRGKQERDFLYIFLIRLSELSIAGKAPFAKVRKVRKQISRKELVASLAAFADTPSSLITFLSTAKTRWELPAAA